MPLEESAEDLYEHAPCGYLSTLPDGTIIRVNRTFLDWTGYSREELLAGKQLQELFTVAGRIFHETHYAPLLRMQGFAHEISFDLVSKDRRPLPVLLNSVLKKDPEGNPLAIRTTVFNISDRRKYERELQLARKKAEQAVQAKSEFLSTISHEIRTPLNAIIGLSHLLRETPLSPQQEGYVRILNFSSESLLNLINNILDFSKLEAGKVSLEERSIDVRQLVYSTVHNLGVAAEEKNLPVRVEVDEQVPDSLLGDPIKLGQILTNLLSNALKFTERGAVTVSLRLLEQHPEAVTVEFRVTDTGIGIAPDRLEPIFEEFTQASYDINLKYRGTGLGLAISRKLLEVYGGKLCVESTLGEGASFSFQLRMRVAREPAEAVGPAARPPEARSLQGVRVLVAEDNGTNAFLLGRFLEKWGVAFDVVSTGQQAVEHVTTGQYDLVLMDLQMPVLNGYDATRAIRELPDEQRRGLPIIALSASSKLDLEDRLDSAGFTEFVGKPFRPEELFTKLAQHGSRPLDAPAEGSLEDFSLLQLRQVTQGDRRSLVELGTLTLENCENYRHEFQRALETGDRSKFDFHAHKIKVTLELLRAHALRTALNQGQRLLEEQEPDPARIQSAWHAIQRALDAIIEALKEAVREP
jgi:PAS domain S-box-containing protein